MGFSLDFCKERISPKGSQTPFEVPWFPSLSIFFGLTPEKSDLMIVKVTAIEVWAYTLLDEQSILRVSDGIFNGCFGCLWDYLGVISEVFWMDFKRKTIYKSQKDSESFPKPLVVLFTERGVPSRA